MSKKNTAAVPQPEVTAISLPERAKAAIAYGGEQELVAKAAESKHITTITNQAGREQVHAMRMVLKNARVEIEKRGKAAREDANAFRDAVIEEQKRLIGLVEPEEERLEKIQDEWDGARERERQTAIKAEQDRVEGITRRIDGMRALVQRGVLARASGDLSELMKQIDAIEINESFAEFKDSAADTKAEVYEQLDKMHAAAMAREQEAERLAEERAAFERQRAEQAERDRLARENEAKERDRKNAIARRIEWLRGNQSFTAMTSPTLIQQNIDELQQESITEEIYGEMFLLAGDTRDAAIARLDSLYVSAMEYRREQDKQAVERERQRLEQERIDRERAELEAAQRKQREEQEARERAEREAADKKAADGRAAAEERERLNFKPAPEAIVQVLCTTYQRDEDTVTGWLREYFGPAKKKAAA